MAQHGWQTRDANFASHPDSTMANAAFRELLGAVVPWTRLTSPSQVDNEGVFHEAVLDSLGCLTFGDFRRDRLQ
jgi:hypothetical protein